MALRLETWRFLSYSLLEELDLTFKGLNVVQELVLLGHVVVEVIVELTLFFTHQIRVLLVKEEAGLLG